MRRIKRIRRAWLLKLLSRQTPEKLMAVGHRRLHSVFQSAAQRSSAYRAVLQRHGVEYAELRRSADVLKHAPVLEKEDLFDGFSLRDLVQGSADVAQLAGVLTSSGHGGSKFAFGMSTRGQMKTAPEDIDLGLEQAFGIDERSTLLVNCLPMGVVFNSNSVCVANVSVREDMAFAIINQAGPMFEQVILCTDPLFSKRFLDYADAQGFDWSTQRTHVILGEEMFTEEYRSYLASAMAIPVDDPDGQLIGSSMGVGELGLNLFFETPETVALRRAHHRRSPDTPQPSYFCFNPLRSYVEIVEQDSEGVGDLVVTMLDKDMPIPMIRYRTGDRARWLNDADLDPLDAQAREAFERMPFPRVAMLGRARDRIGADWHVDQFKALLYRDHAIAKQCSGAFRVTQNDDGVQLFVQLALGATDDAGTVQAALSKLIEVSAGARGASAPAVKVYEYAAFPFGMGLDYERKFRYFPGPSAAGSPG